MEERGAAIGDPLGNAGLIGQRFEMGQLAARKKWKCKWKTGGIFPQLAER